VTGSIVRACFASGYVSNVCYIKLNIVSTSAGKITV